MTLSMRDVKIGRLTTPVNCGTHTSQNMSKLSRSPAIEWNGLKAYFKGKSAEKHGFPMKYGSSCQSSLESIHRPTVVFFFNEDSTVGVQEQPCHVAPVFAFQQGSQQCGNPQKDRKVFPGWSGWYFPIFPSYFQVSSASIYFNVYILFGGLLYSCYMPSVLQQSVWLALKECSKIALHSRLMRVSVKWKVHAIGDGWYRS